MLAKALVAEAVGTFALCLVGAGSILVDAMLGDKGPGLLGIALAHGLILSVAVTATMNVSGGHINPAVTAAMMATRRISLPKGLLYVLAQLVGAVVAGLLLANFLFDGVQSVTGADVVQQTWNGTPHYEVHVLADPRSASGAWQAATRAGLIEAVLTFLLVFAVFGTAVDPRRPNVGGFGIGLTLAAAILAGGPLTGAALNPARAFGTGLMLGSGFWQQQPVYWIGPIVGGLAAGIICQVLILERSGEEQPHAPARDA